MDLVCTYNEQVQVHIGKNLTSESELLVTCQNNQSPGPLPGRLVPSSHQRSFSNSILGTFSREDEGVWKCFPIPNGLGEKARVTVNPLYNVSVGPQWFMTLKWICRCNVISIIRRVYAAILSWFALSTSLLTVTSTNRLKHVIGQYFRILLANVSTISYFLGITAVKPEI